MSKPRVIIVPITPLDEAGTVVGSSVPTELATSVVVDATLTGNTGGALDIYLQREVLSGVWRDWIHFAQLSAGAAATTITLVPALASETGVTAVGVGDATTATPALAAGDIACPLPNGNVRAVAVSGASTSASVEQTIYITCRYD